MDRNYVEVFVEIPQGSRNKYEYDKERRLFVLDRVLYSSVHYPGDYGFVPDTLAADGDPLDALVIVNEPTFPGCLIEVDAVALFRMTDAAVLAKFTDKDGNVEAPILPAPTVTAGVVVTPAAASR